MSRALFEQAADGEHQACSAGTAPANEIHPEVLEVIRELGIDLADRRPRMLDRSMAEWADIVITMGCGEQCPYIPGKRYIDWELPDPSGRTIDEVRAIRDEIGHRVQQLAKELDSTVDSGGR